MLLFYCAIIRWNRSEKIKSRINSPDLVKKLIVSGDKVIIDFIFAESKKNLACKIALMIYTGKN